MKNVAHKRKYTQSGCEKLRIKTSVKKAGYSSIFTQTKLVGAHSEKLKFNIKFRKVFFKVTTIMFRDGILVIHFRLLYFVNRKFVFHLFYPELECCVSEDSQLLE